MLGESGNFLDVGAWDGKTFSNTLALAERGWKGVLVEANPLMVLPLLERYGGRDGVRVLQALVVPERCEQRCLPFWITRDGVSTADEGHYEKWKDKAQYLGRVWLPALAAEDLVNEVVGDVDFVNVDVEGSSVDVALALVVAMGKRGRTCKVWCIEHDGEVEVLRKAGFNIVWCNHTNAICCL